MTWYVKSEARDGKVGSTLCDDLEHARKLRDEFVNKGFRAWIEDVDGSKIDKPAPAQPAPVKK